MTLEWRCSCCGDVHDGLPLDWAYDAPAYWEGPRGDGDVLVSDWCIWTDDEGLECYFVRGVIELPIVGSDDMFAYGVWSSLSRDSFERFMRLYDDPRRVDEPPYFGWLSNAIADYPDTRGLPLWVTVPRLDARPTFRVHDDVDHPLAVDQRRGIGLARVREVAERRLHTV